MPFGEKRGGKSAPLVVVGSEVEFATVSREEACLEAV